MRYVKALFFGMVLCLSATVVWAGDIDDPGGPTDAASAMYTITDVYNRINDGTAGTKRTTTFGEPTAAPGSTGKTLTELYDLASERSRPAKTGQTESFRTHDDGDLEKGVMWPAPRFTDNTDGTVTDNLTGLIWLKNANCAEGKKNWNTAVDYCAALFDGCTDCFGTEGDCGLSDSSSQGDWRLPSVKELQSLIDFAWYDPPLSNAAGTAKWTSDDAFTSVELDRYWSSTTYAGNTAAAWNVKLDYGVVASGGKTVSNYVWPVRAGQ